MATNYTATCNDKIPRWFASLSDHSSSYSMPSRPRTDNVHVNKPAWLSELVQSRRHSEQLTSLFNSIKESSNRNNFPSLFHDRTNNLMKEYESDGDDEITLSQLNDDTSVDSFEIPCLPYGKMLHLLIESNWGDENFVGFNGLEIFDAKSGHLAHVTRITVNDDPSEKTNALIDQVYRSHDEEHIWQMSLDSIDQFPISLKLYFEESIHIALIRIWNHNKSRIYWDRGIKNIQMFLDERRIFQGEITRVHGSLSSPVYNLGDTILFTTDDGILEKIAHNDKYFK